MSWKSQAEIIKQLSDKQLVKQLYLTQFLLLIITIVSGAFLFSSLSDFILLFQNDIHEILLYGITAGVLIITIDVLLMFILPKRYYDDGGINERIFRSLRIHEIFIISLLVAVTEEVLFRGVIQTNFGYMIGSLSFALVHIRYLTKPVLLISVLLISFYIGWMYELTHNLFVTIAAHFLIDFVLGLMIRLKIMR